MYHWGHIYSKTLTDLQGVPTSFFSLSVLEICLRRLPGDNLKLYMSLLSGADAGRQPACWLLCGEITLWGAVAGGVCDCVIIGLSHELLAECCFPVRDGTFICKTMWMMKNPFSKIIRIKMFHIFSYWRVVFESLEHCLWAIMKPINLYLLECTIFL